MKERRRPRGEDERNKKIKEWEERVNENGPSSAKTRKRTGEKKEEEVNWREWMREEQSCHGYELKVVFR